MDEHEVVDERERLLDEHLARRPPDRRRPLLGPGRAGPQRAGQHECGLPVARGQVGVAAAHREPVLLADGRGGDDGRREVDVPHHPPDEEELLGVLLAVVEEVTLREVHELGDDREHPVEVPRPRLPLEQVPERPGGDAHPGVPLGVDDVGRGCEDEVHPFAGADLEVVVEGPRVLRQVLLGPELERVEEDRHEHVLGPLAGGADEPRVALVEGAHGHDDGDVTVTEGGAGGAELVTAPGDDGCAGHRFSSSRVVRIVSAASARSRPVRAARRAVARA